MPPTTLADKPWQQLEACPLEGNTEDVRGGEARGMFFFWLRGSDTAGEPKDCTCHMIAAEHIRKQGHGPRKIRCKGIQEGQWKKGLGNWPGEQAGMNYRAPFVAQLEAEMESQSSCPDLMLHFSSFKLTSNWEQRGIQGKPETLT